MRKLLLLAMVVAAPVGCAQGDDEHTQAWCGLYEEFAELSVASGEDDIFTDPAGAELVELERIGEELNELGYPSEIEDVERALAAGPGFDGTPENERYRSAVDDLESFITDECDLDPEIVQELVG